MCTVATNIHRKCGNIFMSYYSLHFVQKNDKNKKMKKDNILQVKNTTTTTKRIRSRKENK